MKMKKGVYDEAFLDVASDLNSLTFQSASDLSKLENLLQMFESSEPKSYHTFIRSKGMSRRYNSSADAFSSMERTIDSLKIVSDDTSKNISFEITGHSFAYN